MSKSNGPIRRWLSKMGLVSSNPSEEEQVPTAELPKPDVFLEPEPEVLTEEQLEISTADTRPLPADIPEEPVEIESKTDEEPMEIKATPAENGPAVQPTERGSGPLLDLGEFEPARAAADDDFVLDLDFDEIPAQTVKDSNYAVVQTSGDRFASVAAPVVEPEIGMATVVEERLESFTRIEPANDSIAEMHSTVESKSGEARERTFTEPEIVEAEPLRMVTPAAGAGLVTLEQLSPEAIDAIARRAVELLSEKVVQEVAWEVVPQLAELMIKRQLEEKNS